MKLDSPIYKKIMSSMSNPNDIVAPLIPSPQPVRESQSSLATSGIPSDDTEPSQLSEVSRNGIPQIGKLEDDPNTLEGKRRLVSGDRYLDKLASVESGGNYNAHNKGSGARGKYQFIPSTEKAYAKKLGMTINEARTPDGQERMIESFTDDNKRGLERAGIEPTDMNLWVAHNQGLSGAIDMIKHGKGNTKNIKSNISGGDATVENYLAQWSSKF